MLQETLLRLEGLADLQRPIVVCNEAHRFLVAEQLRQVNGVLDQVIRAVEFLFGFTLAAGMVVLFAAVSAPLSPFQAVLDRYYHGARDATCPIWVLETEI